MHIVKLIAQHVDTLSYRGHTAVNLLVYFGIPLVAALVFTAINFRIGTGLFTPLIVSLSIFSSLLFSLHMMIYRYMKKVSETDDKLTGYFFRLYINVTFCILVAVTAITVLFTYGLKNQLGGGAAMPLFRGALDGLAAIGAVDTASAAIDLALVFSSYYLLFVFLGAVFLILGRVHQIIDRDPKIKQF